MPCSAKVGTAGVSLEASESCSKGKDSVPEKGAKEKYAAVLTPAACSSLGLSSQALARPKVPANLVTSWSSSAAQRVLTCLTNQEPGLAHAEFCCDKYLCLLLVQDGNGLNCLGCGRLLLPWGA